MILPLVFLGMAVGALVGLVRTESLALQLVFAFWAILATVATAQTSTDEAIAERRKWRQEARELKAHTSAIRRNG